MPLNNASDFVQMLLEYTGTALFVLVILVVDHQIRAESRIIDDARSLILYKQNVAF